MFEKILPETFAEIVEDLLHQAPPEHRRDILKLALAKEEKSERARRAAPSKPPDFDCWHDKMTIKAAVAYTFVRNITNNHSVPAAPRRARFGLPRPIPAMGVGQGRSPPAARRARDHRRDVDRRTPLCLTRAGVYEVSRQAIAG
jgi:hypothetical protein